MATLLRWPAQGASILYHPGQGGKAMVSLRTFTYRELVGGADQFLAEARVVGGVASVVNDHELGAWPHAVELPCVGDGCLKVKSSVHHDPGDVGQQIGIAEQAPILQPGIVPDIVG